jgi:hypothetical protein
MSFVSLGICNLHCLVYHLLSNIFLWQLRIVTEIVKALSAEISAIHAIPFHENPNKINHNYRIWWTLLLSTHEVQIIVANDLSLVWWRCAVTLTLPYKLKHRLILSWMNSYKILSSYLQWFPLLEEAVKWKYIHHLPVLILQATSDKYSVYRNNCLIANFSVQYYYIFSTAAYKYMK